jgi:NAD(P)-dependent dehydrogenase (short-subunit alcohol dehydrogenase family)
VATLEDKVAIVTGAAGGIGRASARAFAREGARVAVVDIDDEPGHETVELIRQTGGEAAYVHADVSRSDEVQAMVATTVSTFGRLDVAHNNAGIAVGGQPLADTPEEDWHRAIDVMLTGVFLCMKYEIPEMLKAGAGAIVNTASGAGLVGYPGTSGYVAAKHGVVGLTKVAALDYGRLGVRVNAVCPGTVWSPMVHDTVDGDPAIEEYLVGLHPIGRIGQSEEVAEAAVWLCTDAASFVLGHAMSVDGGYVIH